MMLPGNISQTFVNAKYGSSIGPRMLADNAVIANMLSGSITFAGALLAFAALKGSNALNYAAAWTSIIHLAVCGVARHRETLEFGWELGKRDTYAQMACLVVLFVLLEFSDVKSAKRIVKDEKKPAVIVLHLIYWFMMAFAAICIFR